MERTAVKSRDIAIIGYDDKKLLLEIAFRGGGVYHYMKVPRAIYDALMKAESQGTYFNKQIKDQYPYTKVS